MRSLRKIRTRSLSMDACDLCTGRAIVGTTRTRFVPAVPVVFVSKSALNVQLPARGP